MQMEAQANTTREQSNKKNIYDVGWPPSHGENGGVGKKKKILKTVGTQFYHSFSLFRPVETSTRPRLFTLGGQ